MGTALLALIVFSAAFAAEEAGPGKRKNRDKLVASSSASKEEVASGEGFTLAVERIAVDGKVPSAVSDWNKPPGDYKVIWGYGNHFWPVSPHGKEGVVWWDESSKSVKMKSLADDSQSLTLLQPEAEGTLTWAASTDKVIILWIAWPNPQKDHCKESCSDKPARMMLYKIDAATGGKLQEKDMTNIFKQHRIYSGAYAKYNEASGTILVSFRVLGLRAKDKFNHQGCMTWSVNPDTLDHKGVPKTGLSHCYDNSITINPNGGADIGAVGDVYCRGIKHAYAGPSSLLEMNATVADEISQDHFLETFDDDIDEPLGGPLPLDEYDTTEYDESEDIVAGSCDPKCGASYSPQQCPYRSIMKFCKKYQALYLEIGHPFGRTESGQTFSVFGAETTPSPCNCAVGSACNFKPYDPRNLVFKTQEGGENGERALTDFKTSADGSVSRIKQATLEPGRHLLMYEVWKSNVYDSTVVMIVDDNGDTLAGPWTPSLPHRVLAHQDELYTINGKLVFYDGSGSEIQRYTITYSESTCVQTTDWAAAHKAKDVECKAKGLQAVTEVVPPSNRCSAATDGGKCKADYRGLDCDGEGCVAACSRCG
jgi:hypothetical protein